MSDTVAALVRRHSASHPSKPMVIDPVSQLTYADLDAATSALAEQLITAGVTKGSRVGLLLPNGTDWVVLALAVLRIGAVLVPLSTLLRPKELVDQLGCASVQYLIAADEFRGRHFITELSEVGAMLPALRTVWNPARLRALASEVPRGFVDALAATVRPSDPMVIVFTSGSSGAPKGILHSHGNALAAVASGLTARCVTADTRLYLPMPLFWVGGFGAGLLTALVAGATLVTEPSPSPETTLALLERERVTLFRGWPEQAVALARHAEASGADLSDLRVGSLDALLPAAQRAAPGARANLFGMTESFGPYCGFAADTDMPRSAWGSCGQPFPGMTVRIADAETGRPVPACTVGVIQLRGPHVLRGICRRSREDVFTADGYYSTGDLGSFDTDGFLFYHGRADDMFKVSGATVYPVEVERALRTVTGVRAVHATNVPGRQGNRVGAAVVCDTATVTVEELTIAVKGVLSSFKVPTVWLLVDDDAAIPRLASGKVDVVRLREALDKDGVRGRDVPRP